MSGIRKLFGKAFLHYYNGEHKMEHWTEIEILDMRGRPVNTHQRVTVCKAMQATREVPEGYVVEVAEADDVDYSGLPEA